MRQAIMTTPGKIEFREAPEPTCGSGEVLLKIQRIGVCGTDIHVYHGKHPFTPYPVIQGHEFSAKVIAVGKNVTRVVPGMKATARPQLVCGKCPPCKRGDYNICDYLKVQGFQAPGVAQDLFVTTEEKIIPLPDSMSFDQGALIEPAAVAAHATARAGDLTGKNIVVFGAGTIGNLVAQAAQCRGANKIMITDLSEFRLEKARQCGIGNICNISKQSVTDAVQQVFGTEGFSVAFEAVGVESALDDAVQNIQKGGEIIVLGVFGERPRVDMSVIGDRELNLIGTLMYKHEDYEQAIIWIADNKIITEPIITKHFPFNQYLDAYKFIETQKDKTLKVMIDVNDD